jgi:hypothetical protein
MTGGGGGGNCGAGGPFPKFKSEHEVKNSGFPVLCQIETSVTNPSAGIRLFGICKLKIYTTPTVSDAYGQDSVSDNRTGLTSPND